MAPVTVSVTGAKAPIGSDYLPVRGKMVIVSKSFKVVLGAIAVWGSFNGGCKVGFGILYWVIFFWLWKNGKNLKGMRGVICKISR